MNILYKDKTLFLNNKQIDYFHNKVLGLIRNIYKNIEPLSIDKLENCILKDLFERCSKGNNYNITSISDFFEIIEYLSDSDIHQKSKLIINKTYTIIQIRAIG